MSGSGVRLQMPDVLSSVQLKNLELKSLTIREFWKKSTFPTAVLPNNSVLYFDKHNTKTDSRKGSPVHNRQYRILR